MQLIKDAPSRQYSLPGEQSEINKTMIIGGQTSANVFVTGHSNRIHSSNATAFLFAFAKFQTAERPTEAVECAVSFCAQVIKSTVVNGMLKEESKFAISQLISMPRFHHEIKHPELSISK